MPATHGNNDRWLAQQLAQLKTDVAALKAQQTQYVVDTSGNCQAIVGHLQFDHQGNSTGLGNVWGLASHKTGSWVQL